MVFIRSARKMVEVPSVLIKDYRYPSNLLLHIAIQNRAIGNKCCDTQSRANVLLNPFIYITWPSLSKLLIGGGTIASSKYISPKESSSIIKIDIAPIVL